MVSDYYKLTKPGIIYGNMISAFAGFFLASRGHIDWLSFLGLALGLSLVIASACVFNNVFDADIDLKMERTKMRSVASGEIDAQSAKFYGGILLALGAVLLVILTNYYSLVSALVGFVVYVYFYTPLKRTSVYSTIVGAVSGAMPIVAGYLAVVNNLDAGAILLFVILFLWQMPHFYAIGIFRLTDYKAAGLPILPVSSGVEITKVHILVYTSACCIIFPLLTFFNITGNFYLVVMIFISFFWLWRSIDAFLKGVDETKWAKQMFKTSLVVLTLFCVIISTDHFVNKLIQTLLKL